jgi:hypothetical protein
VDGFGDSTPEDAWDLGDPPVELLRNLYRRHRSIRHDLEEHFELDPPRRRRLDWLERDLLAVIDRLDPLEPELEARD